MTHCFLTGTKKHGCQIDNEKQELTYFDYLSLIKNYKNEIK